MSATRRPSYVPVLSGAPGGGVAVVLEDELGVGRTDLCGPGLDGRFPQVRGGVLAGGGGHWLVSPKSWCTTTPRRRWVARSMRQSGATQSGMAQPGTTGPSGSPGRVMRQAMRGGE